jgi:hypothetical protein
MTKAEIRKQLLIDQINTVNNGGYKVTVCKPQKTPKNRKVTVKSKLAFSSSEPVNRPSNAWDIIIAG